MRFRLPYSLLGFAAAAWLLAAPAAHAFTIENKDAGGQYAVPKFDLEEQARNFRKDGTGATGNGTGLYETPLGTGKLQFGIQQGSSTNFGSVFAPGLGPDNSAAPRASTWTACSRRRARWTSTARAEGRAFLARHLAFQSVPYLDYRTILSDSRASAD